MSGSAHYAHQTRSAQEHYNEGKRLCQSGCFDASLIEFQVALDKNPNSAAVHFWVGKAHVGCKNTNEAIKAFQQSACLDPANAKPHMEMGRLYVAADQLGAAMAAFRQAERLTPQSAEILRDIAAVLVQQCQYDAALHELQRAVALEPSVAMTHVMLGRVYDLKGIPQQSDLAYRQAERLDPRIYAQAQIANGVQLETAGRLNDAIKQYEAATLTDPALFDAFLHLGSSYVAKKYYSSAADAFRAAVRLDPNSYIVHYMLGWLLLEQSQVNLKAFLFKAKTAPPDEAVQSLRRAVELNPDETAAHLALGKTYQALGVRHLAREQFEQVLALTANGEDAASARDALQRL